MTTETYEKACAWLEARVERIERHSPEAADLFQERLTDLLDACYTGDPDEALELACGLDADPPPGYEDEDLVLVTEWCAGEHPETAAP